MNQRIYMNHIKLTSICVMVIALSALAGWVLNIPFLITVLPGYASMKFNTALLLFLAGLILYFYVIERWGIFRIIISAFIAGIGLLTFSQDIFSQNWGIDQLLFTDHTDLQSPGFHPGRMAQGASLSFFLLGLALLTINAPQKKYRHTGQYLLHTVSVISFLALTGYLLDVPSFYKLSAFGSMAVHTAALLLILSVAASFWNPQLGITGLLTGKGVGNAMARQLLPSFIIAVLFLSFLPLYLYRQQLISLEFGIPLFATLFTLIGLLLIFVSAKQLNRINVKKDTVESELINLNKNLEKVVEQRTTELNESIKALQESRNELWRSEQLLKGIINNTSAAIFVKDVNGNYILANKQFASDLEMEIEDIVGKNTFDIFTKEVATQFSNTDAFLIATKQSETAESTFLVKGLEKTTLTNKFPLLDEQQNVFAICGVATDFTELKKSKTEQELLSVQLQQKNQQLLNFAHITSHNLRSPVSNLNSLLWLYKESQTEKEKILLFEKFEIVIRNLSNTLDELVDALKIQEDTGKKRELLSFEEIFKKVKDSMIGKILETEAVVSYNFTKAASIEYPRLYLESILQNLLSNSMKYRSPNRTPVIYAETFLEDDILVMKFKDNGLGIDMNRHRDKLFGLNKTFHRHHEAKGVGLFITKTQVEAMGGSITAESEIDKGTTFIIYFNKKVI